MAGALDIIHVVARMIELGQVIENVFDFVSPSAVNDSDVRADISAFLDAAYTGIADQIANNLTFVDLVMTNATDNTDIGIVTWDSLTAGTATGDLYALGVSACITFPTQVLGCRGRKFIGGVTEPSVVESLLESSYVADLLVFAGNFVSGFLGQSSDEPWAYVIPSSLGAPQIPISATLSNVPSYQRRRKQGVGI